MSILFVIDWFYSLEFIRWFRIKIERNDNFRFFFYFFFLQTIVDKVGEFMDHWKLSYDNKSDFGWECKQKKKKSILLIWARAWRKQKQISENLTICNCEREHSVNERTGDRRHTQKKKTIRLSIFSKTPFLTLILVTSASWFCVDFFFRNFLFVTHRVL